MHRRRSRPGPACARLRAAPVLPARGCALPRPCLRAAARCPGPACPRPRVTAPPSSGRDRTKLGR